MKRTQICFGENMIEAVNKVASKEGVPMAEIVRRAAALYLLKKTTKEYDPWQKE